MSKIIIISSPPWGIVMPPLGMAYLATYLKSKGIVPEIYDLNLQLYEQADQQQEHFWDLDTINKFLPVDIAHNLFAAFEDTLGDVVKKLVNYDIVGFSANNLISTTFAGIMGTQIKNISPKTKIILGGPGCFHSWDRKAVPKDAVDFFIIGEGEEALYRLIMAIDEGDEQREIPGVICCAAGDRKRFYPPEPVKNLDVIPFPTFEEFDVSKYSYGKKYRPLPMLTSRGCINQCAYCIDCYMSAPFRARSPEQVVSQISYYKKHYGITHVEFNDLLCNGNLIRLEKLCDQLIEAELNINWISYAAIRRKMNSQLLEKMRKAGCTSLCFGVESGSDSVLARMNKHYIRAEASALLKKTHEAGITARLNLIVGFPGETEENFQQTLDFIKDNMASISQVTNVSSFVLMPGSDIGIYPYRFGVKFLDPLDPGIWTDEFGLTQQERNNRVARACRLLEELNIPNLIINYQSKTQDARLKTQDSRLKTQDSRPKTQDARPKTQDAKLKTQVVVRTFNRDRLVSKIIKLIFLFVFSLIIDIYLFLLKKIRGSIIFPGN
ncbi:MAG: radical SAM protein [Candidatus Omnitrophota bacterium]